MRKGGRKTLTCARLIFFIAKNILLGSAKLRWENAFGRRSRQKRDLSGGTTRIQQIFRSLQTAAVAIDSVLFWVSP